MIRCGFDQTYVKKGGRNVTNRTTSNHWSHSSLLSLHMFDQNHI
jgi:hypothetical protein